MPICKACSCPLIGAHQLRHTAATIALEGDVHPKLVQEMLRHSSYSTIMDIYGHVVPSMHGKAASQIHEVLQAARETTFKHGNEA